MHFQPWFIVLLQLLPLSSVITIFLPYEEYEAYKATLDSVSYVVFQMTNMSSIAVGHQLLLSDRYQKLTVSVCVGCLVADAEGSSEVTSTALACCYNFSLRKVY